MKKRGNSQHNAQLILTCLALTLCSIGFGQAYSITDLGARGGFYSEAHGISPSAGVVGEFEPTNSFYQRAFYYHDETNVDIGSLGPNNIYAIAYAINSSNVIVGESSPFDPNVAIRAFSYSNGVMSDLGTLAGTNIQGGYSSAHGINKLGQVVGEATTTVAFNAPTHAVLYSAGSRTDLGTLGGNYSNGRGINDSGVIVGETDAASQGVTNLHAFVYTNGAMHDLGTLGGAYSSAAAINNAGDIVGEAETVSNSVTYLHAFRYRNGVMQDLGTLGHLTSSASAINSAGQIVGYVSNTDKDLNAFLYNGSAMLNLNDYLPPDSGWLSLATADGINDAGEITGAGTLTNGEYHAYLLSPVGPLTVTITNPAPNATFVAPATFTVRASVADTAGTVTNVQFLVNSNVIGNATSSPYTATASELTAGSYYLKAVASDNGGLKATNGISVTVNSSAPSQVLITDSIFTASDFSFSFTTQTGFTYEGQFTQPLSASNTWLTFTSLVGSGSVVRVTDTTPTNAERYYRVLAH